MQIRYTAQCGEFVLNTDNEGIDFQEGQQDQAFIRCINCVISGFVTQNTNGCGSCVLKTDYLNQGYRFEKNDSNIQLIAPGPTASPLRDTGRTERTIPLIGGSDPDNGPG